MRVAFILTVILGLLAGCTSIPVEQRESKRAEIDGTTEDTIIILSEKDADFSAALANAAGYFAGRASASTVAVIGGAYGIGVLVDLSTGERTYMNIKRLDLGAGLGVQKYRGVMLASDEEELEAWRQGAFTVLFRQMLRQVNLQAEVSFGVTGKRSTSFQIAALRFRQQRGLQNSLSTRI